VIVTDPHIAKLLSKAHLGASFRYRVQTPITILFALEFLMQAIYLPASLSGVHVFGKRKSYLLRGVMILFAAGGAIFCFEIYSTLGVVSSSWMPAYKA
jgi:hypothetical protein